MLGNRPQREKEIQKARKENADIAAEKVRTKRVKELKTLDELMKEKS